MLKNIFFKLWSKQKISVKTSATRNFTGNYWIRKECIHYLKNLRSFDKRNMSEIKINFYRLFISKATNLYLLLFYRHIFFEQLNFHLISILLQITKLLSSFLLNSNFESGHKKCRAANWHFILEIWNEGIYFGEIYFL